MVFYMQDANGPSAESILAFHDLVMVFVVSSYLLTSPPFRNFKENQILEFSWTCLPMVSLFALALPSLRLLYLLDEVGSPCSTLRITSSQWYWRYESSDMSCSLSESYLCSGPLRLLNTSSNLHLPSELVLRMLLSSTDVLHS